MRCCCTRNPVRPAQHAVHRLHLRALGRRRAGAGGQSVLGTGRQARSCSWTAGSAHTRWNASARCARSRRSRCSNSASKASTSRRGTSPAWRCAFHGSCAGARQAGRGSRPGRRAAGAGAVSAAAIRAHAGGRAAAGLVRRAGMETRAVPARGVAALARGRIRPADHADRQRQDARGVGRSVAAGAGARRPACAEAHAGGGAIAAEIVVDHAAARAGHRYRARDAGADRRTRRAMDGGDAHRRRQRARPPPRPQGRATCWSPRRNRSR